MTQQLQQVKWAEFKIGELFEKLDTANVINNKLGDLPATTAVWSNNQIGRYISRENATILKNVFSATANGFGKVFYQPYEFTVLQDSYAFKFKDDSIDISKIHSFIVGILNKIYAKYDWGNKSGWAKVKEEKISLPVKKTAKKNPASQEIDFDFMEKFIAELEARHIAELEAYLLATGLKNYELTTAEKQALHDFENGKVELGEYSIGNIFDIATGRDVIIGRVESGEIPLVSHQHENNGITKYIKLLDNRRIFNHKTTLALADRGVFYATNQYEDFHIGTRVKALIFKYGEMSKNMRLFYVASINKLQTLFTEYSINATDKLPELKISLPVKKAPPSEGLGRNIDFDFMENLIRAVQKLVIKEVVEYADRKITGTKEIIKK